MTRRARLSIMSAPAALSLVAVFVLAAVAGPFVAPYAPYEIDLPHQYDGPSMRHWLGTGDNGVDLLSGLLHGARLAGVISVSVVAISLIVGLALGTYAGLVRGAADHLVMGIADVLQSLPGLILAIAILALADEPGITHMVVALSSGGWVIYARLARATTLSLREQDFVLAAAALGAGRLRILCRHLAPNLIGPLVVQATVGLGGVLLAESTLSFLGLGPGRAISWGALLDQGTAVLLRFPHVALISGGTIAVFVLAFNASGDWLHDRLARW